MNSHPPNELVGQPEGRTGLLGPGLAFAGPRSAPGHWGILSLVALGVLVRLGFAYLDRANFTRGNASGLILSLAANLASGDGFTHDGETPDVFMEPAYPFLIALAMRALGRSWLSFACLHAALGTSLILLTYLTGKSLFGRKPGLWAAAAVALYPYLLVHGMRVNDTVACAVALMLFVFCSLRATVRPTAVWYGLCGSSFGLGMLTRSSFIALGPLLFLVAADPPRGFRRWLRNIAVSLAAAAAITAPWLYRNHRLTGRIFISLHGGWPAMWLGNNEYALKYLERNVSLDAIIWNGDDVRCGLSIASTWRCSAEELLAVQPRFRDATMEFLRTHWDQIPRLVWYRAAGFWSLNLNPRPASGERIPAAKQWAHRLTYGPLLFLAIIGVGISWKRRNWRSLLVLGAIALYFAPHLLVWGFSRVRLPLDPLLAVYAGLSIASMFAIATRLRSHGGRFTEDVEMRGKPRAAGCGS